MDTLLDLSRQGGRGRGDGERRLFLQALGLGLGVKTWADDFRTMLDEPRHTQMEPTFDLTVSEVCMYMYMYIRICMSSEGKSLSFNLRR